MKGAELHAGNDKPVFMTPAMRKRLAEEQIIAQMQEEKEKLQAVEESRESFFKQAEEQEEKQRRNRYSSSSRRDDERRGRRRRSPSPRRHSHPRHRRDDDEESESRSGDRRRDVDRKRKRSPSPQPRRNRDEDRREKDKEDSNQPPLSEKEKQTIKNHYLGLNKEKKKVIKPSEKFQFKPSWDLSDDTSHDLNPLYAQRHEVKPLSSFRSDPLERQPSRRDSPPDTKGRRTAKYLEETTHWSEKHLDDMTERDWRIFKEDFSISASGGGGLPHPMRNWEESPLPSVLKQTIKEIGYRLPTPIQMAAIPVALQGRDIMGIAQTGSGKTAAFLLPLLVHISKLPPMTAEVAAQGPYALILAPTRDLVLQIQAEAMKFAANMNIRAVAVVGGKSIQDQALQLGSGCDIIVATPNRLFDCLERRFVVFNQCNYIILDEADEMISMGFEPQVLRILESMPESRWKSTEEEEAEKQEQQIGNYCVVNMYSATMPIAMERLSKKYLRRAVSIHIESENPLSHIEQRVLWTKSESEKKHYLQDLLQDRDTKPPIIVFCNTKIGCNMLCGFLEDQGFKAITLHAGKNQQQREFALDSFKEGKYDVLVATDVMGRGIDVKGVTHVINFDVPDNIEDYTHRIGRTGRAGKTGIAVSYISHADVGVMNDLKKLLQKTGNKIPPEMKLLSIKNRV